ncbi:transmembrane protein, putative (macronuclear) [Tetrahymena thermophila SB210]|uniref:Transmembrane protein, putative n=1 Tax=Tetrahymena thermophila (strain SB210) TaxID=312017 RepID=I7MK60_TETTS|nr:transmembrane protein, putative [Tetrahymena thermophila SB210]EAR97560.2 transmembrane protein, putative [Tetrahymena thermophila SB210]|eukprot:XP_001017805.2 transmembrane protein, putative [Tetrahymena thermophila SB210]
MKFFSSLLAVQILILTSLVELSYQTKIQFIVQPYYPAVICQPDTQSLQITGIEIEIVREALSYLNYQENKDYSFTCERNFQELTSSIQNLSFLKNTTFQIGIDQSGISSKNLAQGFKYSQPIFSGYYVVLQHTRYTANYFTFTFKAYIMFLIGVSFIATYYALKHADSQRLGWLEYAFIVSSSFFLNREPLISHAKAKSIQYGFYFLSGLVFLFGIAVFIYYLLENQASEIFEYSQLNGKDIYTIYGDSKASLIVDKINAKEFDYKIFNNTSSEFLNYYDTQRTQFTIHKEYQGLTLLSYLCNGDMHMIGLPYNQFDGLVYNLSVPDTLIQQIDSALLQVLNKKSVQERARSYQTKSGQMCQATPADYIRFFHGITYYDLWGLFLIIWLLPLIWILRKLLLSYYKKYHPVYYKEAKQEGIIEYVSYKRAHDCGVLVDDELCKAQKNLEQDVAKRDEHGIDPLVEHLLDDRQINMDQIKQAYEKSKKVDFTNFKKLNSSINDSFNSSRSMALRNPNRFKGYIKNPDDACNQGSAFDSLMPTNQDGIELTPLHDYFRLKFGQSQKDNNSIFFQTLNRKHQNNQEGVGLIRMLSSIQPPNADLSSIHGQILANNSHDGSLPLGMLYQTEQEKKNRFRFNIVKQSKNQQGEGQLFSSQIKKSNLGNQNSLPLINLEEDDDYEDDILHNGTNKQYYDQFHHLKKQKSKVQGENQNESRLKLKHNNFMGLDELPSPQKQKSETVIDITNQNIGNNQNGIISKDGLNSSVQYEHKGKEHMFIRNIKRSQTGLNKLNSFILENQEDIEKDFNYENPSYRVQPSAKKLLEDLERQNSSQLKQENKQKRKVIEHQKQLVDQFFNQHQTLVIKDNDLTVEVLTFRDDEKKEQPQIYDLDSHKQYSSNKSTKR